MVSVIDTLIGNPFKLVEILKHEGKNGTKKDTFCRIIIVVFLLTKKETR